MKPRFNLYSKITNIFILVTVFVIAVILHLTLATTTITVLAKAEAFVFEAPIDIAKTTDSKNLYGEIVTVELTDSSSHQASKKIIQSDKAGAVITISNKSARNQSLVKTTRFLTSDNKLFRLTETVNVPANDTISAYIEADQTGDGYLVPAGHFTIPGLNSTLQKSIYGDTAEAATTSRAESSTLSQSDIDQAATDQVTAMMPRAITELQKKLGSNLTLEPEQLVGKVLEQKVDKKVGSTVGNFQLDLSVRFSALIFDKGLLLTTTKERLKAKLPSNVSLIQTKDDTFNYKLTDINPEAETAVANVHLEAEVTAGDLISSFIDRKSLRGKTKLDAENYLRSQGVEGATITLSPFWVTRVPNLDDHIIIKARNQ